MEQSFELPNGIRVKGSEDKFRRLLAKAEAKPEVVPEDDDGLLEMLIAELLMGDAR